MRRRQARGHLFCNRPLHNALIILCGLGLSFCPAIAIMTGDPMVTMVPVATASVDDAPNLAPVVPPFYQQQLPAELLPTVVPAMPVAPATALPLNMVAMPEHPPDAVPAMPVAPAMLPTSIATTFAHVGGADGMPPSADIEGHKKNAWKAAEDAQLTALVAAAMAERGKVRWPDISQQMGGRSGKQCRERWHNHLTPEVRKDGWTAEVRFTVFTHRPECCLPG